MLTDQRNRARSSVMNSPVSMHSSWPARNVGRVAAASGVQPGPSSPPSASCSASGRRCPGSAGRSRTRSHHLAMRLPSCGSSPRRESCGRGLAHNAASGGWIPAFRLDRSDPRQPRLASSVPACGVRLADHGNPDDAISGMGAVLIAHLRARPRESDHAGDGARRRAVDRQRAHLRCRPHSACAVARRAGARRPGRVRVPARHPACGHALVRRWTEARVGVPLAQPDGSRTRCPGARCDRE